MKPWVQFPVPPPKNVLCQLYLKLHSGWLTAFLSIRGMRKEDWSGGPGVHNRIQIPSLPNKCRVSRNGPKLPVSHRDSQVCNSFICLELDLLFRSLQPTFQHIGSASQWAYQRQKRSHLERVNSHIRSWTERLPTSMDAATRALKNPVRCRWGLLSLESATSSRPKDTRQAVLITA
jgi:hypothetical protein